MNRQEFCESTQQLFRDIEKDTVSVELVEGAILEGMVKYQTSNGWTIVVFSDGYDWDYISSIIPPSGEAHQPLA